MIPKIIHQIWIGDKAPIHIEEAMLGIKNDNKDFEYILWDNDNIHTLDLPKKVIDMLNNEDRCLCYITDVIRLLILNKYGGLYIDADTISIKPLSDLYEKYKDNRLVNIRLNNNETDQLRYSSGYIFSESGELFNPLIESYDMTTTFMAPYNKFVKDLGGPEIPHDVIGLNGSVLKDLRMGSWRDKIHRINNTQ
jgi:mannosyltransferase OCH1-like enzyme